MSPKGREFRYRSFADTDYRPFADTLYLPYFFSEKSNQRSILYTTLRIYANLRCLIPLIYVNSWYLVLSLEPES